MPCFKYKKSIMNTLHYICKYVNVYNLTFVLQFVIVLGCVTEMQVYTKLENFTEFA